MSWVDSIRSDYAEDIVNSIQYETLARTHASSCLLAVCVEPVRAVHVEQRHLALVHRAPLMRVVEPGCATACSSKEQSTSQWEHKTTADRQPRKRGKRLPWLMLTLALRLLMMLITHSILSLYL